MFKFYTFNWFQFEDENLKNHGTGVYHTSVELGDQQVIEWVKHSIIKNSTGKILIHSTKEITCKTTLPPYKTVSHLRQDLPW